MEMQNTWELDPAHSSVQFSVRHLGIANIRGGFTDVKATLFEYAGGTAGRTVDVSVGAGSINTHNETRDAHLRGEEFFNAEKFPHVTFRSRAIRDSGDGRVSVLGDFTLLGVSREVTLEVEGPSPEVTDPFTGAKRIGASARTTISRRDFGLCLPAGMDNGLLLDDKILITIEAEFVRL